MFVPAGKRPTEGKAPAAPSTDSLIRTESEPNPSAIARSAARRAGTGQRVPEATRGRVERKTGVELGRARMHTGPVADEAAEELGAAAFTFGNDVFFGADADPPDDTILAHELAHVAQQTLGSPKVQRLARDAVPAADAPLEAEADAIAEHALAAPLPAIVDDETSEVQPGQARKTEYLDALARRSGNVVEEIVGPEAETTACPYLDAIFRFLRRRSAKQCLTAARAYVGDGFQDAESLAELVLAQLRVDTMRWRTQGTLPTIASVLGASDAASRPSSISPRVQRRAKPGAAAPTGRAGGVAGELGPGRPLDSALRQRMEHGFGASFSGVRVHTGPGPAAFAETHRARALTIGQDVVFGRDEYNPTTRVGDVLIAHELAHTLQQRGAPTTVVPAAPAPRAWEADADASVAAALARMAGFSAEARRPRQVGLTLQRCGSDEPEFASEIRVPVSMEPVEGFRDPRFVRFAEFQNDFLLDGDGDQERELRSELHWRDFTNSGVPTALEVSLTQLESSTRQSERFPLPRSMEHLAPQMIRVANGRDPAQIRLSTFPSVVLSVFPPTRSATEISYRVALESTTFTFTFPIPRAPQFQVFQAEAARRTGPVWSIDVGIGAFRDRFRLTFARHPSDASRVTFGMSPLSDDGPVGGQTFQLQSARHLDVSVVGGSATELAIDLDGDGTADLFLHDSLRPSIFTPPGETLNRFRKHHVGFSGSAVPGESGADWEIREGQLIAGHSPTWEGLDFAAASQADIAQTLPQVVRQGSTEQTLTLLESQRLEARRTAATAHVIDEPTARTWAALEVTIASLQSLPPNEPVVVALRAQGARQVLEAYAALNAEVRRVAGPVRPRPPQPQIGQPGAEPHPSFTVDRGPYVALASEIQSGDLAGALRNYALRLNDFDRWIARRLSRGSEQQGRDAQALRALVALTGSLTNLERFHPQRVWAIVQSDENFRTTGRAQSIPIQLYYYQDGEDWHLVDLSRADAPFDATVSVSAGETEPPRALFEQLNYKRHFPVGFVYYELPSGTTGRVEVSGDMTWSEFLGWVGLGAVIVGTTLASLGTAAPAWVATLGTGAIAVGALAGATSAALDLAEEIRHGTLTAGRAVLDVAQIVAGVAGGVAVTSGRLVATTRMAQAQGSPFTGNLARAAIAGDALLFPATVIGVGADLVSFAVIAPDIASGLAQIARGPGSSSDKARAALVLLGQAGAMAAMAYLSVRGVTEFPAGRSLRLDRIRDVVVARAEGLSFAGRSIAATSPLESVEGTRQMGVPAGTTADAYQEAVERHVAGIRRGLAGAPGEALASVEHMALGGAWHVESTLRILDPLSRATSAARRGLSTAEKEAFRDRMGRLVEILNDPTLSASARRSAWAREMDAMDRLFARAVQSDAALQAALARARSASLPETSGQLLTVDARRQVRVAGRPAGTLDDLVDQVRQANNVSAAHGLPSEYVVVVHSSVDGGVSPIQVLPRQRPLPAPAVELPPPLRDVPASAEGRYVVDIGVAGSGYGVEMVPQGTRSRGPLVQTDVAEYATAAQQRRDLSIEGPGPVRDEGSVLVLGDALSNLELFFGRPAQNRGVRLMTINSVNAAYTPGQYRRLAEGLSESMGRGGRVEVRWDTAPERLPSGAMAPRGHIDGALLGQELQALGQRRVRIEDLGRSPVSRPGSIESSRVGGGTRVPPTEQPTPPDPGSRTGRHVVITFEN